MKPYLRPLIFCVVLIAMCAPKLFAQSLGDAVVKITFGAGTATRGGAIPAAQGSTTYTYTSGEVGENQYTITNVVNTAVHSGFVTSTDHTGDSGGYMMVVNGSLTAGTVFTRPVTGLCGNTQYQFGVWVKNVLTTTNSILPNMVFHIYAADGTTELGTGISTGDVPVGNVWHNYTANFTLPAGTESVVIKLVSNASGQVGNDFAVDDITFSPYGSTVSAIFNGFTSTTQTSCASAPQTFTISATSTLATGYVQKLQQYINGAWTDLTAATTQTSFPITSPTVAGTYQYRLVSALAANVSSVNCVVASNNLTIVVNASPTSFFTATTPVCFGNAITFTDASTTTGSIITSWLWEFGDGLTSTDKNPTHTYAAPGSYTVKLTVTDGNGCSPGVSSQTVVVNPLPVATFTTSSPNCIGMPVTITDASTTGTGTTITTWAWDFGDGSTDTKTTNAAFTHTYAQAGSYAIKLTLTNSAGCSAITTRSITVTSVPVADFTLPDVCLNDAFAQFTDKSTVDGVGATGLSYLWTFGDANATAANPNTSTLQNPMHKYSQTGNYTVTLTVTSPAGCVSIIKTQTFTVNGAVPKAGLTVESSANLCSSEAVIFANTSTVDFGNITKVVFYYDAINNPTASETFLRSQGQIPTDNKYYHSYGAFTSPATKTYHVKMVVYSGETCFDAYETDITLKASPTVTVSSIAPLCQSEAPVQFTTDAGGFSGTGVFSGSGVSLAGLFSPAVAGAGTHTITYVFTGNNGCTYSTTRQVTVYPVPSVSLASSVTILEGGQTTLQPTLSGSDLTYKWTPATGLSATDVAMPIASPTADITYTLTVTNSNGCTSTAYILVTVLKTPVVPNAFTPNGDGVHDTWVIRYLDSYPNCRVEIYNRYGAKLYSSRGYPTPWDGRYNGSDLPAGVYYYIITPGNGIKTMAGSLTLLR